MFLRKLISFCVSFVLFVLNVEGKVVQLHGAGATFPSEVYLRWIIAYQEYRADHMTLDMTYAAVGSGVGKALIKGESKPDPPINYAGSDIPLNDDEQREFPNLKAFPVMAGAVAVAFNLKDVDRMNLSIPTLCGIYNGTIRFWNHPVLQDMNPGHQLPDKEIIVIARSDKSGTTHSFTSALAASCPVWEAEFGVFSHGLDENGMPIKWNKSAVHFFGYGNRGMSGLLLSLPYSIGYASVADIFVSKLKYARIQNNAGTFVEASTETVQNAILDAGDRHSLLNPVGTNSYPIATYTFFIVEKTQTSGCESVVELVRYVDWFYTSTSAHSECEKHYMVAMESHVAANITLMYLHTLTCGGNNVWALVEEQKRLEAGEPESDYLAVYISVSCLSVLAFVAAVMFGRQRWLIYKDILKDRWFIPFSEVHFEREDIDKVRSNSNSPAFDPASNRSNGIQSPQILYAWETASIQVGVINSQLVFLIKSYSKMKTNTFKAKKTLMWFTDAIDHVNVAKLVGLTKSSIRWLAIYKGQTRGTVVDITRSETVKISASGLVVLCKEIIQGMEYLHEKGIVHGNLKGSCCLVDMTWKVKITDWQDSKFRAVTQNEDLSRYDFKQKNNSEDIVALFWVAPELIKFHRNPTYDGDVYSFGIVMQELFSGSEPYSELTLPPKNILTAVLSCCLRPKFSENTPPVLRALMDKTWELDPAARPTFTVMRQIMKGAYPDDNSLTDCIVKSVEEYASSLEKQLFEAKRETVRSQEASKAVLLDNAPLLVVEKFMKHEKLEPASYKLGTVLACSLINLSQFVSLFNAGDVVNTLEELLTGIDQLAQSKNITKLSVNGENLVFVSDPKCPALTQVQAASTFAIMTMNFFERISKKTPARYMLHVKMGIATGPIFVCVLGRKTPKYTVFGEAVAEAFKMQYDARQSTIRLSKATYDMLKQRGPMFEVYELRSGPKAEDESSYWLVSQQGLAGKFDPVIQF